MLTSCSTTLTTACTDQAPETTRGTEGGIPLTKRRHFCQQTPQRGSQIPSPSRIKLVLRARHDPRDHVADDILQDGDGSIQRAVVSQLSLQDQPLKVRYRHVNRFHSPGLEGRSQVADDLERRLVNSDPVVDLPVKGDPPAGRAVDWSPKYKDSS